MMKNVCRPANPVSVVAFHGTADQVAPFHGGEGRLFQAYKLNASSTPDTIRKWVEHNGCGRSPVTENPAGDVLEETYSGGKSGTEVCLYTLSGGLHAWPGGRKG